jgi:predicted transcriptional regulator
MKWIGFNTKTQFIEKFVENETQRIILKPPQTDPKITAKAIASQVNMTFRRVQKNIDLEKIGLERTHRSGQKRLLGCDDRQRLMPLPYGNVKMLK